MVGRSEEGEEVRKESGEGGCRKREEEKEVRNEGREGGA